jgi:L-threonylcarbamoyladenylate synthase
LYGACTKSKKYTKMLCRSILYCIFNERHVFSEKMFCRPFYVEGFTMKSTHSPENQKQLYWGDVATIAQLTQALRQGRVVVGASDTVIGFLAATTQAGFDSLNTLKKRDNKPYLLLLADAGALEHFAHVPPASLAHKLITAFWPGPLTIIVHARPELPAYMTSHDGTVALRVPDHPGLQALLRNFNGLFSTSANLTGQPVPATCQELNALFVSAVAYVVDEPDESKHKVLPSTIVDCTGPEPKIVREGAITAKAIHDALARSS